MRLHLKNFQTFFLLFCIHCHLTQAHPCDNSSSSFDFQDQLSRVQKCDNRLLGSGNIFDSLEIGCRTYQQFYSLNVIGISNDFDPNKSLPFHVISRYSFLRGKPKWHTMNLTYSFDWNVRDEVKSALQLALKEWASATPFKFYQVRNFSRANIKISFMSGDHGDGYPFGGSTGGLAHGFPPPDGRIHFDNHQNWSWTGKRNAFDVQTAGLHELGHVLGLGHSTVLKAIMYPVLDPGVKKRLHKDDIDGIKALYRLRGKLN